MAGFKCGKYLVVVATYIAARGIDVEALGHVGITYVITLMGFYTSVAMILAFYDVPADAPGMAR